MAGEQPAAPEPHVIRPRDGRWPLRRVPLLPAIVLAICLSLVGGAAAAWGIYQHYGPVERVISQAPAAQPGSSSAPASVGAIATAAAPSVVKVLTQPVSATDLQAQPKGFAVGFVASSDGLVVTSAHALEGATALRIALADGHIYAAVVVGADVAHGIAVLRAVGASGLSALPFAGSAARPGDLVVAVGAPPFGGASVDSGVVSSVGRSLSIRGGGSTAAAEVLDAMTIDATADPQADGAPLLDAAGRVVGVVVVVPGDPALPGVVALSGRDAAALVDRLSHGGTSVRPTFGVTAVLLDAATAAAAGLPPGALVRSVAPAGPADKGGILRGDVITAVNGVAVDADHPLDPAALGLESGQTVSLSVTRAHQGLSVSITIADGAA